MPCANPDASPREAPAAAGGGVNPIAIILRQRPSIPNGGDESEFEAKEAGSMVARRRREGERRERKTRKSTGNNGAAVRGQTADEEGEKVGDFMATAGVVPRPLVRQNSALSLQVIGRGFARL